MADDGSRAAVPRQYGDAIRAYELAKREWIASHPAATPAEYEAAMRALADRYRI